MDFTRLLLLGAGLLFLAVGISSLVDPAAAMRPTELQLGAVSAYNEIRANYGGMHSLLGLFLIYAVFTPRQQSAALLLLTLFSSGLVLGRITSLVVDGLPNAAIFTFLVIECFGAVAGFVLLRRSSSQIL